MVLNFVLIMNMMFGVLGSVEKLLFLIRLNGMIVMFVVFRCLWMVVLLKWEIVYIVLLVCFVVFIL